jgi:TRAP-type mannitol/chloroaromatic compound transport system substrate-binding protein
LDIFPALERGVIDATEFSMPAMDIKLGFHQVAKFNYFPGWHQSVSMTEIMMNKQVFDALPKSYKKILEIAAGNQLSYTYAETEATQFGVMAEMRDKHKVQVKRWKDSELATFEQACWTSLQKSPPRTRCSSGSRTTTWPSARITRSGVTHSS